MSLDDFQGSVHAFRHFMQAAQDDIDRGDRKPATARTHRPSPQADGHPGALDRTDLALAICAVVAAGKEAGVGLLLVLHAIADTWEHDLEFDQDAPERITG